MKYTSPYRHRMIPVRTVMETEYYRMKDMREKNEKIDRKSNVKQEKF